MVDNKEKNSLFKNCLMELENEIFRLKAIEKDFGRYVRNSAEGSISILTKVLKDSNLSQDEKTEAKNKFQRWIACLSKKKANEKSCREYLKTALKEF